MIAKIKGLFWLVLALLPISTLMATDGIYTPLIQEETIWTQAASGGYTVGLSNFRRYSLMGTVELDGLLYDKMYYTAGTDAFDPCEANYGFAIREDETGKVWVRAENWEDELLYMDFGAAVGDEMEIQAYDYLSWPAEPMPTTTATVLEKDSILVGSEYRDRLRVGIYCGWEYWIEGVGNTRGFFRDFEGCFISDGPTLRLLCHQVDGQIDYEISPNACNPSNDMSLIATGGAAIQMICLGQNVFIPFEYGLIDEEEEAIYLTGGFAPFTYEVFPTTNLIDIGYNGVEIAAAETADYTITVTDAIGNSISHDVTIEVATTTFEPLVVSHEPFTDDCLVDSLLYSTPDLYSSYTWTTYTGEVIGTEPSLVVYGNDPLIYLTVENEMGCSETVAPQPNRQGGQFLIDDRPSIEHSNFEGICEGDTIRLWPTEVYESYEWSVPNLGPYEDTLVLLAPLILDDYWIWEIIGIGLTVVSENGCELTGYAAFSGWYGMPDQPMITVNGSFLESTEAAQYRWYLDGEPLGWTTDQAFEPLRTGEYMVEVSNNDSGDLQCSNFSEPVYFESTLQTIKLKVCLEGAYETETGLMHTILKNNCLLPIDQPYNIAPWNYNGNETVIEYRNFPDNTVDWILVEMRTGSPDFVNQNTTVVETKSALLLSDGDIIEANGNPLRFESLTNGDEYYLTIRHRNHLDILSAIPIIAGQTLEYDFTLNAEQALGPQQQKVAADGKAVMYAGDYNPNGVVLNTDFDEWFVLPAAVSVYTQTDGNLDGVVQTTDYDYWFVNKAKLGVVEIQY